MVVWCFLMLSDEIFFFDRVSFDVQGTLIGHYKPAAYGNVGLWMCATLVLLILTVPYSQQVLRTARASPYKWMALFAVLCFFSVSYSPSLIYSLAWAMMLLLVVWAMVLLAAFMRNRKDVVAILRVALGAFGLVVLGMFVMGLFDPSDAWYGAQTGTIRNFRLGGNIISPTDVSAIGGLVLLLVLILYTSEKEKRNWMLLLGLLGACVLFLGTGKTAIVASVIAAVIFVMYQKGVRVRYLAALFGTLCPLFLIVFFASPVGDYFTRYPIVESGRYTGPRRRPARRPRLRIDNFAIRP